MKNEDSASESEDLLDGMQIMMILSIGVLMVIIAAFLPFVMQKENRVRDGLCRLCMLCVTGTVPVITGLTFLFVITN